jgi:asparagine synthase (glutamine-hydrolysing)
MDTSSDADLLRRMYLSDTSLSFLRKIDGIFSAVVFDSERQCLHLITDRYGLRHLYWTRRRNGVAWASEVKAFLALPEFKPRIDRGSVGEFFSFGYLLGNRTWLEDVALLPPGSTFGFDLRKDEIQIRNYWSWSNITLLPGKTDTREMIEELGRLFNAAIKRQCESPEPVGVSLSGGLDSRAILAAAPDHESGRPIHAVTMGSRRCDDVRIAAQVARVKGIRHHVVELTAANWLSGRIPGVWYTDGQSNLLHMHALVSVEEQRAHSRINLNGFLGDAVLGGSYLHDPRWSVTEKADNRGRRFINEGTRLTNNFLQNRLPFFSNALMEYTCSIPEELRDRSKIYNRMLLSQFPVFFRRIPWQRTGVPITWPRQLADTARRLSRLQRRMGRIMERIRPGVEDTYEYTNYAAWIRQQPARALFERMIVNPCALYPEFIPREEIQLCWREHMGGLDRSEKICRTITFELWLQQVFEHRFRDVPPEPGI